MDLQAKTLAVGTEVEGFRIESVLGSGGFGITYKAIDLPLDRLVAIKEYLPNTLAGRFSDGRTVIAYGDAEAKQFAWGLDRFRSEAKTLVAFQHPNIIPVHRFFEANGTGYLVMAFQDGKSLAEVLESVGKLPQRDVEDLLRPLAIGLAEVHDKGFLHRDIKPANIYIRRDGSPVLIDFGSARHSLSHQTQGITAIITEGYAPYEQYEPDGNQGPWTDVYALGAVMYHCVTGERPIDAPKRIAERIRNQPDPLKRARDIAVGDYSPSLLLAIDSALAVLENERPQSVRSFMSIVEGGPAPKQATPALRRQAPPPPPPAFKFNPVDAPSRRAHSRRPAQDLPHLPVFGNPMVDSPSRRSHSRRPTAAEAPILPAFGNPAVDSPSRRTHSRRHLSDGNAPAIGPTPVFEPASVMASPPPQMPDRDHGAVEPNSLMAHAPLLPAEPAGGPMPALAANPAKPHAVAAAAPAAPAKPVRMRTKHAAPHNFVSSGAEATPHPVAAALKLRRKSSAHSQVFVVAVGLAIFAVGGAVGATYFLHKAQEKSRSVAARHGTATPTPNDNRNGNDSASAIPSVPPTPAVPDNSANAPPVPPANNSAANAEAAAIRSRVLAPERLWSELLPAQGQEIVRRVFVLNSGNLLLAGDRHSPNTGRAEVWLRWIDGKSGRLIGEPRIFANTRLDTGSAVALLADGTIAIAGGRPRSDGKGQSAWVARLGADGEIKWEKTFGEAKDTIAYAVAAALDGGLIVSGTTNAKNAGGYQGWLLRLTPEGATAWEKTFGGGRDPGLIDSFQSVSVLSDGGIIAAGTISSRGAGGADVWVLKVDQAGQPAWGADGKYFGSARDERAKSILALPDGDVFVLAETLHDPPKPTRGGPRRAPATAAAEPVAKPWFLRLTFDGNLRRQQSLNGGKDDKADSLDAGAMLADGGFFFSGSVESKGAGRKDGWLVRMSSDLVLLWDLTLGKQFDDELTALAWLPDGGVIVAGSSVSRPEAEAPPLPGAPRRTQPEKIPAEMRIWVMRLGYR